MSQLNKASMPIAVEHHSRLDLPFDHVTTASFMTLQPLYYRHTIDTEKLSVQETIKVRPQPMPLPTFGRMRANVRHFFVPYRLVFPNYTEFFLDNIATNFEHASLIEDAPRFHVGTFLAFILGRDGGPVYADELDPNDVVIGDYSTYDFSFRSHFFKFTTEGRFFYKVYYSLGYGLLGYESKPQDDYFNALSLLSFVKIYLDWYANTQYKNGYDYLALEKLLKYNNPMSPLELTTSDFDVIFNFIRKVTYQTNGYFEAAWDNPVSPNNGQFSNFVFADPTANSGSFVTLNNMGTPEMFQENENSASIGTQYLHTALKKLQDYQHRHALAGAASIDRLLAEFGIVTDAVKLQRSIYLGCSSVDINVGEVYATANGQNDHGSSVVGDFAGRSLGGGQFSFTFQNDEPGIIMSVVTIQPSGGYYQGYDRNNRHLKKRDFFNPAFDQLGVQAIEKGEVYLSKEIGSFDTHPSDYFKPFGYTGRYGEYKRSICRVSGDVSLPTIQGGGNSWHLMREFTDQYFDSPNGIHHSEVFTRGDDADQFNRVFNYTENDRDPFQIELHAEAVAYAPCSSLTDEYDWETTSKQVSIEINGGKLN